MFLEGVKNSTDPGISIAILIFWFLTEIARLYMGDKGNKCEESVSLFIHLLLAVPVSIGHFYFLLWQTTM